VKKKKKVKMEWNCMKKENSAEKSNVGRSDRKREMRRGKEKERLNKTKQQKKNKQVACVVEQHAWHVCTSILPFFCFFCIF